MKQPPKRNLIGQALRAAHGARPLYAPRIIASKRIYCRKGKRTTKIETRRRYAGVGQ